MRCQQLHGKMPLLLILCALALANPSNALPTANQQRFARELPASRSDVVDNIVGVASNVLAAEVLRSNANANANFVFSPLGFSSILAILAEGARGKTAERLNSALQHPADSEKVRSAYKTALGRLQGDSALVAPQFKTWLYIYRNNSVRDEFRNTLRSDYHVEVKDIDRYDTANWGDDNKDDLSSSDPEKTHASIVEKPATTTTDIDDPDNSKDIVEFDALKVNNNPDDATRLIDDQRDASKFDEVVEDKQYVEVPVIREEIAAQQQKHDDEQKKPALTTDNNKTPMLIDLKPQELPLAINSNKKTIEAVKQSIIAENNQYVPESVVIVEQLKETAANIKEQLKEHLKTAPAAATTTTSNSDFESLEITEAQPTAAKDNSNRFSAARNFGSPGNSEVASVISGNSIVGKKIGNDATPGEYESKLILFNGLYYRGSWQTPFQQLRSDHTAGGSTFYKSDTEKCNVHMMRARGQFKYARLRDGKSQAIELPYDNARYSLLVIVPNSRSGLAALQSELTAETVRDTCAQLSARSVDLSMPKFNIETTGGIEKLLAAQQQPQNDQLSALFSDQADFSGITEEQRLHIDELQQHVSVRVDEGASSENALSATSSLRSAAATTETQAAADEGGAPSTTVSVVIDRPFLFFVRDVIDDVLIVAGKVVEPAPANDEDPVALLLD